MILKVKINQFHTEKYTYGNSRRLFFSIFSNFRIYFLVEIKLINIRKCSKSEKTSSFEQKSVILVVVIFFWNVFFMIVGLAQTFVRVDIRKKNCMFLSPFRYPSWTTLQSCKHVFQGKSLTTKRMQENMFFVILEHFHDTKRMQENMFFVILEHFQIMKIATF